MSFELGHFCSTKSFQTNTVQKPCLSLLHCAHPVFYENFLVCLCSYFSHIPFYNRLSSFVAIFALVEKRDCWVLEICLEMVVSNDCEAKWYIVQKRDKISQWLGHYFTQFNATRLRVWNKHNLFDIVPATVTTCALERRKDWGYKKSVCPWKSVLLSWRLSDISQPDIVSILISELPAQNRIGKQKLSIIQSKTFSQTHLRP